MTPVSTPNSRATPLTDRAPGGVVSTTEREAGPDEEADRYGQGSLINDFEHEVATLLGKEEALFLPSGTMAQQIALQQIAVLRSQL